MPELRPELRAALQGALRAAGVDPVPPASEIGVERPRERAHGDWSSNVALVCAKAAGRPPRELAAQLVAHIEANLPRHVASVEVAGPGFVNFCLSDTWLHETLREVIAAGIDGYARHNVGASRTVDVEFVSANPTGPLHAGHGRWAAYGDSLCRLFERCGYSVVREFYVNDRGRQTEMFADSLAARRAGEALPEDGYKGQYVAEWASEMPTDVDPRQWGINRARRDQAETLESMNVAFDLWVSEQELVSRGAMDDALAELRNRNLVREGDGALWLRSSEHGDNADRVLIKSDGEPTYLLPDIAYHHEKLSRADLVIDILGADHHGYTARMRAALVGLGHDPSRYEVLLGQNVTLWRGGEQVRLSKRAGNMVTADELVAEVGSDVARLTFLLQSIDTPQTVDIDVISAQSAENPVYYMQYAYARTHSLARTATERGVTRAPIDEVDLGVLADTHELDVLRCLAQLPDVVLGAMSARAPHQVSVWARELAAAFHRFWHNCPILRSDVDHEVCQARLWLVEATRVGLSVSLGILGVSAPQRL